MRLYINDVAVRDGFQIEPRFIPTASKVELIDHLSRTGLLKGNVQEQGSRRNHDELYLDKLELYISEACK